MIVAARAGPREPHRRPHRLHGRPRPADGDRPVDRDPRRARRRPRWCCDSSDAAETGESSRSTSTNPAVVEPRLGAVRRGRGRRAAPGGGIRGRGLDDDPDRRWALVERRARGRGRAGARCRRRRRSTSRGCARRPSSERRACRAGSWTSSHRRAVSTAPRSLIDCRDLTVSPVSMPGRPRGRRGRHWRAPRARIVGVRGSSASVRSRRADHRSAARRHHRRRCARSPTRRCARAPATSSPRTSE